MNCAILRQCRREAMLFTIHHLPRLLKGLVDVRVLVIKDENGPEAGWFVALTLVAFVGVVLLAALATSCCFTRSRRPIVLEIHHGVPKAPRESLGRQEHVVSALEGSFLATVFPPLHVATSYAIAIAIAIVIVIAGGPLQHQHTEALADQSERDHVLIGLEAGHNGVDRGRSLQYQQGVPKRRLRR